jgi:D-alanine--D-alanine ligase
VRPVIAVLMGGHSVESEISLQTGNGVMQALKTLDYPAARIDYEEGFAAELARVRPAAVFNALHGGDGEDGTVQAVLEWLRIPYQGSGVGASAAAMDKWLTKALLAAEGLPSPRAIRMSAQEASACTIAERFGLPCVVKPRAQGSAVGVSIVREEREWAAATRDAAVGGAEIVVEDYIDGREFTVAILEDEALPVIEITPHDRFYSYHAKYTPGGSTHTVPAQIESSAAQRMQEGALALHRALGCRDYSRVDIMLDASGHMWVLECNTLPGLTPLSLFPDAARASGIPYDTLVERLVLCALSRPHP